MESMLLYYKSHFETMFQFFSSPSPKERMRKHKRSLDKSIRELDRERIKLEQEESKLKQKIKSCAAKNEAGNLGIMAKDLVRVRKNIQRFHTLKSELQAASLRMVTVQSQSQMTQALKQTASALRAMNGRMNAPQLQKIMMQFEKENEIMEMKEEMLESDEEEEEADELVQQVLEEIGITGDLHLEDRVKQLRN